MSTLFRLPLLAGLIFGVSGAIVRAQPATPGAPGAEATADEASDVEASCLLKITFDPQVLPLDGRSVQYLISSSGIARESATKVLGAKASFVKVLFEPLGMSAGNRPAAASLEEMYLQLARPDATASSTSAVTIPPAPGLGGSSAIGSMTVTGADAADFYRVGSGQPGCEEQTVLGRLTVSTAEGHSRAIMKGVTSRLQEILTSAGNAEQDRQAGALKMAEQQVEMARNRLRDLQKRRKEMLDSAGLSDLSRESILNMSRDLEKQRQDLAIKRETMRARQDALMERAKRVGDEDKKRMAEAQDLVKARESEVRALQTKLEALRKQAAEKGMSSEIEMQTAQVHATLADVQAQLRELARQSRGEGSLRGMNDELSELNVGLTEGEVGYRVLQERCEEMRKLLTVADDYELQVGLELPLARSFYENARRRQEELKLRAATFRAPTVTVLGG